MLLHFLHKTGPENSTPIVSKGPVNVGRSFGTFAVVGGRRDGSRDGLYPFCSPF